MGVASNLQPNLSVSLGAGEVTPYNLTAAYSAFVNGGRRVNPYLIEYVQDRDGETIYRADQRRCRDCTRAFAGQASPFLEPRGTQVIDPITAYQISSMLEGVIQRGTAASARGLGRWVGGKTGTTNDFKDNWTIGYTPQFVVGVWVGNSNGSPMGFGVTGLTGAAPIWNGVMQAALNGQPAQPFQRPGDVREAAICNDFGTQNFAECKSPRNEVYYAPLPPLPADRVFLQANIDTFSGLIANANCPDFIEPRTFLRLTDQRAIDWINSTDQGKTWAAIYNLQLPIEAPPAGECQPNQARPSLRVSNPAANQTLSGIVVLNGTVANVPNFSRYQIEIGQGPDAQTFALVGNPYTTQVQGDGVIGSLDTNAFPNGQYVLKLTVIDTAGRFAAVKIPILINNTQLDPNQQIQPTPIVIDGSGVPINPTSAPIIIDNNPQPTPFVPTSEPIQPTPIIIDNNSGGGGLFAPTAIPVSP
jgi:membrane carboxypeptidase/penicillin-binding protein PbpC